MIVLKLDKNNIVIDAIQATLEEAQSAFPNDTWVEAPNDYVGIGMHIDAPHPLDETDKT